MPERHCLDEMAAALEATGDYRVLRRLRALEPVTEPPPATRRGVVLDIETTGLDPEVDEIIELAMLPFFYSAEDQILAIGEPFSEMREPSRPIPVDVTKLTGIEPSMVAGKSINPEAVSRFAGSSLIIAHNAAFDRRFMERFCPSFENNPWACSMSEVPWTEHGFETSKLAFLAISSGFYYDRHRAIHDCHATVELLSQPLGATDVGTLAVLLASARAMTVRCWAENSPFEKKESLRQRGYRWNGDNPAYPRAWWIDVPAAGVVAEMDYLRNQIYQRDVTIRTSPLSAFNRYSNRIHIQS